MMNTSPEGVRSATVIASIIPMLLVYPYLQKHFVKGVLIGSVKG
jgi:putative aldouronate transport system permease protein